MSTPGASSTGPSALLWPENQPAYRKFLRKQRPECHICLENHARLGWMRQEVREYHNIELWMKVCISCARASTIVYNDYVYHNLLPLNNN